MADTLGPHESADAAIEAIGSLTRTLKKGKSPRVRSRDECLLLKSVCLTWFKTYRTGLASVSGDDLLGSLDSRFKAIIAATDRQTSRTWYDKELKAAQDALSGMRGDIAATAHRPLTPTVDTPPSFARLVSDPRMQEILKRRWAECAKCVTMGAPLAALVVTGGLLEALLLARVHRETNKGPVFKASSAPKDKAGKTLQLNEWTLRHYIDVAHELGWISSSAKDVGEVVRDYRNYIHPHKELTHGVTLQDSDAELFWEIAKSIPRQLLA